MSRFLEELITKGFLSSLAQDTETKGELYNTSNVPVTPPRPRPVEQGYSGKSRKMDIGFIIYGTKSPVIKVATVVDGKEFKTTVVKDSNLKIDTRNTDITVSRPNIVVEVGNVNV